jgi:hypothetical protein
MSYHEKENIVNIFSGLLIAAIYWWIVYQRHLEGRFDLTEDFQKWGVVFLIFMGVSVAVRIVIYIIFHILNYIATREEDIPVSDERLKLIKLKATRNSYFSFIVPVGAGFMLMALGVPIYWLFILFIIGGLISELVDNGSQLYYHQKGV